MRLDHQQPGAPEGRGFAVTTYVGRSRHRREGQLNGINTIKDLNGKSVATTTGTTSVQTLRKNKARAASTSRRSWQDHADSFLLLETTAPTPS